MKRIAFLDGLRGLAIILVVCFHAFSRWQSILPYGNLYSEFFIFKYGYLGVQLFFLISGFVILLSLEKTKNFFKFIYKRWIRLFPAMLIATLLIFFTAHFFSERPAGIPKLVSILPGLIFIDPSWIKLFTKISIMPLEGSFWSLYVEVEFYIIFGLSYYLLGKNKAIITIFYCYLLSIVAESLNNHYLNIILYLISFKYFGWFLLGTIGYQFFLYKRNKYLYFFLLVSIIQLYECLQDVKLLSFSIFILLLFLIPIYFESTRVFISNKIFLFFGLISYPLYLIHENAMISLILKISKISNFPFIIIPLLAISIIVITAYFITKIIEPLIIKIILKINTSTNSSWVKWRLKN